MARYPFPAGDSALNPNHPIRYSQHAGKRTKDCKGGLLVIFTLKKEIGQTPHTHPREHYNTHRDPISNPRISAFMSRESESAEDQIEAEKCSQQEKKIGLKSCKGQGREKYSTHPALGTD